MSHLSAAENTLHRTLRGESESRPYSDFSSQRTCTADHVHRLSTGRVGVFMILFPSLCNRTPMALSGGLATSGRCHLWPGQGGLGCQESDAAFTVSPLVSFPGATSWASQRSNSSTGRRKLQEDPQQGERRGGPREDSEREQTEAASAGSATCPSTLLPFLAKPKSLSAPYGDSHTTNVNLCSLMWHGLNFVDNPRPARQREFI